MAECVDDDDATIENVKHCGYAGSIGDGHCMEYNNKEECGTFFTNWIHSSRYTRVVCPDEREVDTYVTTTIHNVEYHRLIGTW